MFQEQVKNHRSHKSVGSYNSHLTVNFRKFSNPKRHSSLLWHVTELGNITYKGIINLPVIYVYDEYMACKDNDINNGSFINKLQKLNK